jgi:sugar O-acyltransferase (sialic acid O-acetyltransferase NeuD family)
MKKTYVILGAGGFAREVICHLKDFFYSLSSNAGKFFDIVLVDDFSSLTEVKIGDTVYKVVKDWNFEKFDNIVGFLVGVGDPNLKKQMIQKALKAGINPAVTLIHPKAIIQNGANTLGMGGVICPGVVVTTNVSIGDYVILNLNCTVGHDAVIENYVTANPGCHISGNTLISESVSLGTGTTVREKIKIAKGVITGAQSCVVKNLLIENVTVTGVPAKELNKNG